jgi:hypothetical protein
MADAFKKVDLFMIRMVQGGNGDREMVSNSSDYGGNVANGDDKSSTNH